MKKILLTILLLFSLIYILDNVHAEENIIPDDAIRFRVIANSNTAYDQNIKIQVRNEVQNKILELTKDSNDINTTRKILNNNLDLLDSIVKNKLKSLNYDKDYKIKYGLNYFPEKKYKGIKYKEGKYESLVITLGKGSGDNWWCVLFPPLCLLESDDVQSTDVEYKSFVKEVIDKYIK